MRKFFSVFLVISLLATAGAIYWRMARPEGASYRSYNAARGADGPSGSIEKRSFRADRLPSREASPDGVHRRVGALLDSLRTFGPTESRSAAWPRVQEEASERQDWAVTISIGSSIISAIGALAQVWLTAKTARSGG
jgi:hypothetical protein